MGLLGERCAVGLHAEHRGEVVHQEVLRLVGVDLLLLLLEEALLLAPDRLQQGLPGCSPRQPCLTSNTRFHLQQQGQSLMLMRIM